MIQIKSSLLRNLDEICEIHFAGLEGTLNANLNQICAKQRAFIEPRLKEIIASKPDQLSGINKAFVSHCKTGRNRMKNPSNRLHRLFNYSWFTRTYATYYCAYDLAKLLSMNTCPYCNRNYTVTVSNGRDRTVRPDFDHFFPRKNYPLLALSFYNLIPSCPLCNRTIKNQSKIVYGKYVHPYDEGFGSALKISHIPLDVDSSLGVRSNYRVTYTTDPLQPEKAERCEASVNLFKIKEIYQESHTVEISELVRKHHISNGKYLEILHKSFPGLGTIEELYRIGFGNYYHEDDFEKRPLSKLTRDIVDQLIFSFPTVSTPFVLP